MIRKATLIRFALALICLNAWSPQLMADVDLFNSNGFEAPTYSSGDLIGQSDWIYSGGSNTVAYAVQTATVAGGSQAVQAFGGADRDASFALPYPDEFIAPTANQLIHIQADIARTVSPATDVSPVFAIDVYNTGDVRTTRFGLFADGSGTISEFVTAPYNNTTNSFDPAGTVQRVNLGSPITAGAFVHFDALLNYSTKTLNLTIGGVNYGTAIPFADPGASNLLAATLEIGTFPDATDSGFFDNYDVSVVTVPEPASGYLCLIGLGALVLLRKRVKSEGC
jgi:hypothetical protein